MPWMAQPNQQTKNTRSKKMNNQIYPTEKGFWDDAEIISSNGGT
jgi:hypothetical protein